MSWCLFTHIADVQGYLTREGTSPLDRLENVPGWQEPGRALCASQMLGDRDPLFAPCSHGSAFIPGNTLRVEVS